MKEGIQMNENIELSQDENSKPSKYITRQRFNTAFPYADYDSSSKIATAIHGNVGHGECEREQLAAWTGQSVKSSGFRTQLSTAKLFGIIEKGAYAGKLKLTELGRRTVDPNKAREAKAEAFLRVPLFKALYDKYKDGVTPPSAALESEIVFLGVAEKQKAKARQVFEKSAKQTGFREVAPNRLVLPATIVKHAEKEEMPEREGNAASESDLDLDPLIMALLRKIPSTGEWPAESRLRWFRTFAMNVSQVYDEDSNPVELTIAQTATE